MKKKQIPIHITKKNSSTFVLNKISTALLKQIQEKFTFLPPGYKFQPRFRLMGIKGVQIKLVQSDGSFPMGLFYEIVKFITEEQKRQVTMSKDVMEHFLPLNDFFKDGISDNVFSDYNLDGNSIKLRDYQLGALEAIFENRNGLLNLSTGAGKCLDGKTKLKIKLPENIINKYKKLIDKN